MNALKLLKTGMRPVVTRKFSIMPCLNKQLMRQPNFDDSFFGMASSVMRNLEREFDFMNRQFNKNLQLSSPVKSIFDVDNMMQNCIQIDDKGDRNFSLRLNVVGFDPEEIQVNTEGQNLQIQAKSEKSTADGFVLKEFSQTFTLPKELKIKDLKSKWIDGVLQIEAPMPKQLEAPDVKKIEKQIPIKHAED